MKIEEYLLQTGCSCYPVKDIPKNISISLNDNTIFFMYNNEKYIALKNYMEMEEGIAYEVMRFMEFGNKFKPPETYVEYLIHVYEAQQGQKLGVDYKLHPAQISAVKTAVSSPICVITGGPGTGKTTTLRCILFVLKEIEKIFFPKIEFTQAFLAPTGKAAKRMSETLNLPAYTVQSYLQSSGEKSSVKLRWDSEVIVDEVSMLDEITAYQLFRSFHLSLMQAGNRAKIRMLLLGDVDQLPSVGIGAVLRDLIASEVVPVCKLEVAYRQADGSVLSTNIQRIQKGYSSLLTGRDFHLHKMSGETDITEKLIQTYLDKANEYGGFDKVFLLVPTRKCGDICSKNMNILLQKRLNPSGKEWNGFRVGDPVINIRNHHDLGICNGDTGIVKNVSADSVNVEFDNMGASKRKLCITYNKENIQELDLAYAMTVHKSQGSEYPCVISCGITDDIAAKMPESVNILNRNLILTAISRAQKECVFFIDNKDLKGALKIEAGYMRKTMLPEFLCRESYRRSIISTAFERERKDKERSLQ